LSNFKILIRFWQQYYLPTKLSQYDCTAISNIFTDILSISVSSSSWSTKKVW